VVGLIIVQHNLQTYEMFRTTMILVCLLQGFFAQHFHTVIVTCVFIFIFNFFVGQIKILKNVKYIFFQPPPKLLEGRRKRLRPPNLARKLKKGT
jgi:hypothetical protein